MKTDTKSTVLLKHHLKALRFPTILAECEKVVRQCAADNFDYFSFLLQSLDLSQFSPNDKLSHNRLYFC